MEIMYKPDKVAGVSQLCLDTQLFEPVADFHFTFSCVLPTYIYCNSNTCSNDDDDEVIEALNLMFLKQK